MGITKADLDERGWTYSSYVKAGDFIFTSICSGTAATITESAKQALDRLAKYLKHAGATLEDLVKVTVTFKKGENFDELKPVFKEYFPNGYPARNTILVDQFLSDAIKLQSKAVQSPGSTNRFTNHPQKEKKHNALSDTKKSP